MTPESTGDGSSPSIEERQRRLEATVQELALKIAAMEQQLGSLRQNAAPSAAPPPALASPLIAAMPSPPPPVLPPVLGNSHHAGQPNFAASPVFASGASARPSLENRIGSQVFNRVGIVALLIGATWFLKLAVDNQWIGPLGRVLVGLVAGAAIIVWSERFRRQQFLAFSYSLKAIGSGVLYLALWAAFQLYHLLPATLALGAMILVTAWNAYMAWAQDAEILAAYALAGGFATPILLSTGGNHQVFLFTYLLAIDIAAVALVRLRSWSRLLLAALPFTVAYFIGWYARFFSADQLLSTILFVLLFFVVFLLPVFSASRERSEPVDPPAPGDPIAHIALPFANAAFVALALYSVLQDSGHHDLLAWVMVALAAVYLGLMRLPQPAVTAAIHLSLAVVFLTVAIPLKATGHWITTAWLAEGLVLLWASLRLLAVTPSITRRTLRGLAVAALALGFVGTLVHLAIQAVVAAPKFFSSAFGTALFCLAVFASTAALALHAPGSDHQPGRLLSNEAITVVSVIAFNLVAIVTGVVQIDSLTLYSTVLADASLQRSLAVSAFLMVYGALLLALGFWRRNAFIRWQALILLVFSILKTFLYDMRNLSQGYRVLSFIGLGALLMAVSFAYQKDWLSLRETVPPAASEAPTE